ncbi:MAG: DUF3990 domain-containing protein [Eubacterium sp.]|uniref:DUF3990 domain-containing protein n=1 Tax=Candidatus Weimeria bifida TaxID=2599074 RepID=A0A6N7IWL8_9FIRM|nr:DUF3990 domain-containing protein [Eubacterium sp.]MQN00673.1 DUF3990 domain-containing protein [Candidatus Weimeria bifida]
MKLNDEDIRHMLEQDSIILYHGSRGGIEGNISPISRERCDFGKGFYMGTSELQAKGLVVDDSEPYFYTLKLNIKDIPRNRILFLSGKEWIYNVLVNRKKSKKFNTLSVASDILEEQKKYDLIVGPIADDQMAEAFRQFNRGFISDTALEDCLNYVDYGYQFVAKTDYACNCIDIITESEILSNEIEGLRKYINERHIKEEDFVSEIASHHRNDGLFLDDIIELESKNENHVAFRKHGR